MLPHKEGRSDQVQAIVYPNIGLHKYVRPCMGVDACLVSEGQGSWWPDDRGVGDRSPDEGKRNITVLRCGIPCRIRFDQHERRDDLDIVSKRDGEINICEDATYLQLDIKTL